MAAIDVVNRVLREFRRYTGDGLPGEPVNAPLPVGDPQSGVHSPKKAELRNALKAVLAAYFDKRGVETLADLQTITPEAGTQPVGVVYADPDPANNGEYLWNGATWVRQRGFPDTFARVALSGSGSAQTGVVEAGVNPADVEVFFSFVTTENTGPLTLSINGGPARQVVNLAGNSLSAGEWTGMVMFARDGERYRLLLDAGAALSAAQSASEAGSSKAHAQEWAQSDDPISEAAGGDGSTDRSAKWWAEQAAAAAVGLEGGLTPEVVIGSSYEPVMDDKNTKLKRLLDASGVTLTIPPASSVAFAVGTILTFEQAGAGQVTIEEGPGVNVIVPSGQTNKSAGENSIFQAAKIDTDMWVVFGALETSQVGFLLGSTQVFTSSGTWTKPAGCAAVRVRVVGAGGGGGGVTGGASQAAAAGGGGGGGYAEKWITSALGATETVTIGAAGTGGAAGANNGNAGGATSFGAHVIANGGGGGTAMTAGTSATTGAPGAGGAGSGGDLNVPGSPGDRGIRSSDSVIVGARGGDSQLGYGAQNQGNNAGSNGTGYGAGGGGAATISDTNRAGGNGTAGVVIVEEYY
ncbi:glycine-rich domain-containing protein [Devosia elaeis]|uniref:Glycine-rich domain-containing protein n=1 Tax=Devosia elaeis TaxID=1770058 RepID=A0A178I0G5_9HYPH|nr:hypothetical protein [Devosia elaeis]OAM77688.1 hypothetical protein A3840_08640 [Devosia elaeis]